MFFLETEAQFEGIKLVSNIYFKSYLAHHTFHFHKLWRDFYNLTLTWTFIR